jgi:hypothetical protein
MDIIALTVLAFLIALFMLYWFNRHLKSAALLMKENRDVRPLFKEKSAELKYSTLIVELKGQPEVLQQIQQLHINYRDKLIDIDVYHDALTQMEQQYLKH